MLLTGQAAVGELLQRCGRGAGECAYLGAFLIPNAADPLLATAQEVERLGLDYIAVQDHPYQRRFAEEIVPAVRAQVARERAAG
jgi:hypothetical protein